MIADAEIKREGFEILSNHLGMIEAERFIALVQRERFDYTAWRKKIFPGLTGEEISKKAMSLQKTNEN
jgi:hypothetical protein